MVDYEVTIEKTVHAVPSMGGVRRREALKRHPVLFPVIVAIALASPFLGLALSGWAGIIAGLVINVVALLLGFRAVTLIINEYEFEHN